MGRTPQRDLSVGDVTTSHILDRVIIQMCTDSILNKYTNLRASGGLDQRASQPSRHIPDADGWGPVQTTTQGTSTTVSPLPLWLSILLLTHFTISGFVNELQL